MPYSVPYTTAMVEFGSGSGSAFNAEFHDIDGHVWGRFEGHPMHVRVNDVIS
jgi:hypothetical protein